MAHGYPPTVGGVERHVRELAARLVGRGVEVEVATCDPARRRLGRSVEDGVVVHRFPTLGDDDVFYISPSLGRWLTRNASRFDLIHAHSYHTPLALQSLIAARLARRPFVLTAHYHGTGHSTIRRLLHLPYRIIGRAVVRASRPLICVSAAERSLLQRHFGHDLAAVIAPNGVDVDEIREAVAFERTSGGRLILSAGRLEPYKRVDVLVASMRLLPDEDELIVLGDGPSRTGLEALVERHGLARRVRVLGQVPTGELRRWLRTADVFVSLSLNEAFGIGLLEAVAGGAAVLATDIAAHREVAGYVPSGRVSFVPAAAGSRDIATALRQLTCGRVDDLDLGEVPRWSDTLERTLAGYATALHRSHRSAPDRRERPATEV